MIIKSIMTDEDIIILMLTESGLPEKIGVAFCEKMW